MNTQCGVEGCACAIYPTFHDMPALAAYYPASALEYETRGDGLTEVRVSTPRTQSNSPGRGVRFLVRPNPVDKV